MGTGTAAWAMTGSITEIANAIGIVIAWPIMVGTGGTGPMMTGGATKWKIGIGVPTKGPSVNRGTIEAMARGMGTGRTNGSDLQILDWQRQQHDWKHKSPRWRAFVLFDSCSTVNC